MQRLYSSFAGGWPGAGLVCLRLAAATTAIHDAARMADLHHSGLLVAANVVLGLLLLVGLWTPVAAAALALLSVSIGIGLPGDLRMDFLLASISLALAMLGPGAWSIDARLFGRKRLIREP